MDSLKYWVIPVATFGIFVFLAIGILFYAYSDLQFSFSQGGDNSSVMSMQDFQQAMDSKLK